MRQPRLREQPAIIVSAFGSTSKNRAALDMFKQRLSQNFGDYEVYWAVSSGIIRAKKGGLSLQQALAKAEADGHRRAVVQPLHIFPGTEYQQIIETSEYFPGLRVFVGETLMHRWDFIIEVLSVVAAEFLDQREGYNILALHGTPLAADPVNTVYLGLERLAADLYPHVMTACVEGVPHFPALLSAVQRRHIDPARRRIRIIPMMYLAGIHVEDDLMGEEDSWKSELQAEGFEVECLTTVHNDETYFKGLAFYPEVMAQIERRLRRALHLARHY
jgi:sirohydrochlorin cobaltochelatase